MGALSAKSSILIVPLDVSMTTTGFLSADSAPQPIIIAAAAKTKKRFILHSLHLLNENSNAIANRIGSRIAREGCSWDGKLFACRSSNKIEVSGNRRHFK